MGASDTDQRLTIHMALEGVTRRTDYLEYGTDNRELKLSTCIDAIISRQASKGDVLSNHWAGRGPVRAPPGRGFDVMLVRAIHAQDDQIIYRRFEENPQHWIKRDMADLENDTVVLAPEVSIPGYNVLSCTQTKCGACEHHDSRCVLRFESWSDAARNSDDDLRYMISNAIADRAAVGKEELLIGVRKRLEIGLRLG